MHNFGAIREQFESLYAFLAPSTAPELKAILQEAGSYFFGSVVTPMYQEAMQVIIDQVIPINSYDSARSSVENWKSEVTEYQNEYDFLEIDSLIGDMESLLETIDTAETEFEKIDAKAM